jgi:hypothetical protein
MITTGVDQYSILVHQGALPQLYDSYKAQAVLCEEIGFQDEGEYTFVGVRRGTGWPQLCVTLRYPDASEIFNPGILLVPESDVVFVGGGGSILAYDARTPRRLWRDSAECGFWDWHRHGDTVLMAAELEFAAWTITGEKLWSTFVEPPWEYKVENGEVLLDVMDVRSTFPLLEGPDRRVRE